MKHIHNSFCLCNGSGAQSMMTMAQWMWIAEESEKKGKHNSLFCCCAVIPITLFFVVLMWMIMAFCLSIEFSCTISTNVHDHHHWYYCVKCAQQYKWKKKLIFYYDGYKENYRHQRDHYLETNAVKRWLLAELPLIINATTAR